MRLIELAGGVRQDGEGLCDLFMILWINCPGELIDPLVAGAKTMLNEGAAFV